MSFRYFINRTSIKNKKNMKSKHFGKVTLAMAFISAMVFFQSCNHDDDDYDYNLLYPNALVTVKANPGDTSLYLQLDSATKVIPTNVKKSPYGTKEVRALANIKFTDQAAVNGVRSAFVNWIDTIRTKPMAANLGTDKNPVTYGNDPLEIVNDWTTIVEDGYLTLRFRTYYGNGKTHILNLVKTDKPYEVVLYQNAQGDNYGNVKDGLIAFRLSDLPDTEGKTVNLTLKWKSFSGDKSTTFKYCTRK